jgi:hypothetical protein
MKSFLLTHIFKVKELKENNKEIEFSRKVENNSEFLSKDFRVLTIFYLLPKLFFWWNLKNFGI